MKGTTNYSPAFCGKDLHCSSCPKQNKKFTMTTDNMVQHTMLCMCPSLSTHTLTQERTATALLLSEALELLSQSRQLTPSVG